MLLRILRLRSGLGQQRVALEAGVSQPTVSRWEKGSQQPEPELARNLLSLYQAADPVRGILEAFFCGSPGFSDSAAAQLDSLIVALLRQDAPGYTSRVPYYADVSAGIGEAQEVRDAPRETLAVPDWLMQRDAGCYALRVVGDSMAPLLQEGDIVIVSPEAPLPDSCIVAAYIEPEGDVVKRYRRNAHGEELLEPLNPAYPVLSLGGEGGREGRIWGRVVLQQREL